jgi:hypothetical protein
MAETPQSLVERLRAEGEKTSAVFRQLEEPDWERVVYADGENWTVRQLLAHFITAEAGIENLIRNVLQGGEGASPDFDIDRFNSRQVAKHTLSQPEILIAMFSEQRARTINLVAGMEAADLLRVGRHPFLGVASLSDIIKLVYRHNQIHQRDLRRGIDAAA